MRGIMGSAVLERMLGLRAKRKLEWSASKSVQEKLMAHYEESLRPRI